MLWWLEKYLFPISMATTIREINSFIKTWRLSSQNIKEKMEWKRKCLFKKNCHKGASSATLIRSLTLVPESKMHQAFFIMNFADICYQMACCIWFIFDVLFLMNPLDGQFGDFSFRKISKLGKIIKKKFCGSSKIFQNILWSINISLKYFMTHAETLWHPFLYI